MPRRQLLRVVVRRLFLFGLIFCVLVGCYENPSAPETSQLDTMSLESEVPEPVRRRGNSYRAMLTKKALRGLDYSTGRVVVDQDLAAAVTQGLAVANAEERFDFGKQALQSGRLLDAIESLTQAVILAPDRQEFYESLGDALLKKKKLDLAEAAFRTALDMNDDSVFAHKQLALILSASLDRLEEALSHYQTAADLDPENGSYYSRMAILNYYLNRSDKSKDLIGLAEANGFDVPQQFKTLIDAGIDQLRGGQNVGVAPTVGAQMRVDLGNNQQANETTCSASDFNSNVAVAGWNDYRDVGVIRSGFSLTFDGGDTWQDTLLRPPAGFQGSIEGDPMTCADDRTGNLWAGAISFAGNGGVYVARLNAGETSFQPSVMAEISGGADKGWMAAGMDPFDANSTRLYIGYNEGLLVSTDDGDSWTGPVPFPEFGLGWLPRVGPNGELYLTYWDTGNRYRIVRSLDGGSTIEGPFNIATRMDFWGIDGSRFPGRFRVPPMMTSAVDPNDGTIYAVFADTTSIVEGNRNVDLYFSRSIDQGSTWTSPTIVNTDAKVPGDQFFPFIEVDDCGRVHIVFYDTRAVVQDDNFNDAPGFPPAMIEAMYAYSDDGGDSWTEIVLTDQPFSSADDGFGDGFIGDYLGMGVAGNKVYPCYMSTHEGIANAYVHTITNNFLLGDINRDGVVNLLDVQPFVDLISSMTFDKAADINGDGSVNLLDVAGFVELINGSGS